MNLKNFFLKLTGKAYVKSADVKIFNVHRLDCKRGEQLLKKKYLTAEEFHIGHASNKYDGCAWCMPELSRNKRGRPAKKVEQLNGFANVQYIRRPPLETEMVGE